MVEYEYYPNPITNGDTGIYKIVGEIVDSMDGEGEGGASAVLIAGGVIAGVCTIICAYKGVRWLSGKIFREKEFLERLDRIEVKAKQITSGQVAG